eukprot:Rhum_TRINITY_DN1696_c0_g1::Rhum_TRINITY_DN1696_c0_g1_i1::g.4628::m.4628
MGQWLEEPIQSSRVKGKSRGVHRCSRNGASGSPLCSHAHSQDRQHFGAQQAPDLLRRCLVARVSGRDGTPAEDARHKPLPLTDLVRPHAVRQNRRVARQEHLVRVARHGRRVRRRLRRRLAQLLLPGVHLAQRRPVRRRQPRRTQPQLPPQGVRGTVLPRLEADGGGQPPACRPPLVRQLRVPHEQRPGRDGEPPRMLQRALDELSAEGGVALHVRAVVPPAHRRQRLVADKPVVQGQVAAFALRRLVAARPHNRRARRVVVRSPRVQHALEGTATRQDHLVVVHMHPVAVVVHGVRRLLRVEEHGVKPAAQLLDRRLRQRREHLLRLLVRPPCPRESPVLQPTLVVELVVEDGRVRPRLRPTLRPLRRDGVVAHANGGALGVVPRVARKREKVVLPQTLHHPALLGAADAQHHDVTLLLHHGAQLRCPRLLRTRRKHRVCVHARLREPRLLHHTTAHADAAEVDGPRRRRSRRRRLCSTLRRRSRRRSSLRRGCLRLRRRRRPDCGRVRGSRRCVCGEAGRSSSGRRSLARSGGDGRGGFGCGG